MFDPRLILAITAGKLAVFLNNLSGTGGTAAPGLLALKIDPCLIEKLSGRLAKNLVITGTNGKTTIARITASILAAAGIKVIHNRAGSNLLRGFASTFVNKVSFSGRIAENYWGLWETDEAAYPSACKAVQPEVVLINNLFRDQLDRYGEIDTVAQGWKKALADLPKSSVVVLNADDAAVASLGKNLKARVVYFGLTDKKLAVAKPDHASDATVCPYCYNALNYTACFAGHMGIYACPKCGAIQPKKKITPEKELIKLLADLPGTYNLYNLTAAFTLASVLKINKATIIKGVSSFKPAFGRMEKIKVGDKTLNIFLVKNPAGFNEVINTLVKIPVLRQSASWRTGVGINCLIAINDLIADGTDVSWLWDVNFEKLAPHLKSVIVSGTRAYDMALRLKYSNVTMKQLNNITIAPDLKKALNSLLTSHYPQLYILPTYTAMLEIRKILNQKGLVHSSWKD